jgi:hypothetical protein
MVKKKMRGLEKKAPREFCPLYIGSIFGIRMKNRGHDSTRVACLHYLHK